MNVDNLERFRNSAESLKKKVTAESCAEFIETSLHATKDLISEIELLQSKLQAAEYKLNADEWHKAVLHECMMTEACYIESDPLQSIKNLFAWHIDNTEFHLHNINQSLLLRISELESKLNEIESELSLLIPDSRYMDPPDGGNVPIIEQIKRMINDTNPAQSNADKVEIDKAIELIVELAQDLESEIDHRYEAHQIEKYPSQKAKYNRDKDIILRAAEFIQKYEYSPEKSTI